MTAADRPLDLERIAARFDLPGEFAGGAPYGCGHINGTFLVSHRGPGGTCRTVLQRINSHVFPDPRGVMANFGRVTRHLRARLAGAGEGDLERKVLTLVPTRDGADYLTCEDGEVWRATRFVAGSVSHDLARDTGVASAAAEAFGRFQRLLADLPGPRLIETIPGFHHTGKRLEALRTAASADRLGRAEGAGAEIDFALERRELADSLLAMAARGELAETVTHGDTKINNVLLDERDGRALCVIDLDTVMPGLAAVDFGELVRSAAFRVAEDDPDPARVEPDLDLFRALVRGFLAGRGGDLPAGERRAMALAGLVMSYENGVRFLTDYLDGDRYFRIHRPGQNLDRARNHFARVRALECRAGEIERLLEASPEA